MTKKERRKKKDRIRMAKHKARRCSTQLAICRDNKVIALSQHHYDWWAGDDIGPCRCAKCIDLYEPGTILGVIIYGGIRPGNSRNGRMFVDLCNMQYWNLIDTKKNEYELDQHTVAHFDMQTVSRVVAKVESRLSLLI